MRSKARRPSLKWGITDRLDEAQRVMLRAWLGATFTDEDRPRTGWASVAPDVTVVVVPDGPALIAHFHEPPQGLPPSGTDWVTELITLVLDEEDIEIYYGPVEVTTGPGAGADRAVGPPAEPSGQ